jgi:MULE transposase domain/FAR1 DNA-binding domain
MPILNTNTNVEEPAGLVLNKGQLFASWGEVECFLAEYSAQNGFKVRKGHTKKIENKIVFECACSRKHLPSHNPDLEVRKSTSFKTGCPFRVTVTGPKHLEGQLHITSFILEHNHELQLPKRFSLSSVNPDRVPSNFQSITDSYTKELCWLVNTGCLGTKACMNLLKEKYPAVNLTIRQIGNLIAKVKTSQTQSEDASVFINFVASLSSNGGFSNYSVDGNLRLDRVFWMTAEQIDLFNSFSDVVITDTTAHSNCFMMPLMFFVGIDNHNNSRILAQALLPDETCASYQWAFEQMNSATGNWPEMVFCDSDPALCSVLDQLPCTYMNCIWHLMQNLTKNLRPKLKSEVFQLFIGRFLTISRIKHIPTFEELWVMLLRDFPLANEYLNHEIYPKKERWAICFHEVFTNGTESTQRVESVNGIIGQVTSTKTSLVDLFKEIEKRIVKEQEKQKSKEIHFGNAIHFNHQIQSSFSEVTASVDRLFLPYAVNTIRNSMLDMLLFNYRLLSESAFIKVGDSLRAVFVHDYIFNYKKAPYEIAKNYISEHDARKIREIWVITYQLKENTRPHFLLVLQDGLHFCTCYQMMQSGIPCKHFFGILLNSEEIYFHVNLINPRWLKKDTDYELVNREPLFRGKSRKKECIDSYTFTCSQAAKFPEFTKTKEKSQCWRKQTYGKLFGLQKQAMQLALNDGSKDSAQELQVLLSEFISRKSTQNDNATINNPAVQKRKGRPKSKRLRSSMESTKKVKIK